MSYVVTVSSVSINEELFKRKYLKDGYLNFRNLTTHIFKIGFRQANKMNGQLLLFESKEFECKIADNTVFNFFCEILKVMECKFINTIQN